uniref:G-protein coupled receptors family 3 profile domain-containing protein n=1 Tax=Loxodonta africana TaxID=9785 RepID=G3UKT2_LOXAF
SSDSVSTEGDMLIRAVTPLHAVLNQPEVKFQQPLEQLLCQRRAFNSLSWVALGLLFAVAEVKGDPTILPNITVGLHIYDSCISGIQALGSTPPLLSNQPQPTPNFSCGPQQLLLSPSTWLSCSLFTESLSLHLPSFLCTVLSNAHQPWVLAQLLSHFNWTWVGLVGADNGNFEWLDQQLQEEMRHGDGCLAFSKIISPGNSISSTARTTASSPAARVIVCDCYRFHVRLPGEEWTRRMWIFSTSFFYDPLVLGPRAQELLNGSLVLAIHSGVMPGFEDFLLALCPAIYPGNSLMRKLWEKLQGCRLPASTPSTQSARDATKHCTGLESMTAAHLSVFKLSDLTATYQAYVATKTLLAAYQNLVSCAPGEGPFLHSINAKKKISLMTIYILLRLFKGQLDGANDSDSPTCQKCPEDQWPNLGKSQCIPQTLDFLSYHEPLGTVLVVCTALLFLLTLAILDHTPIVRANNHQLSYLLLASLGLCFLCPFMFIGHPGPLTYAVSQAASGVTFTVCVSTVLAKTIMVVAAFHATQPNAKIKKWVGPVLPSTVPIVCSLVQAALCMFWVIGWPPRPVNLTEPGSIATVMCDEGSLELFYAMLGYLGLLGLVSLLVAFPACRLPDTFNEAKHIILSTLVCSCIWVSFTPATSSHGKDIVAVEVFAILASGAGLMSCLFFPKRYIVLLHPEKNTREPMLGRHHL